MISKKTAMISKKTADEMVKSCNEYEYDESGLGQNSLYGYNCLTCTKNDSCERYANVKDIEVILKEEGV